MKFAMLYIQDKTKEKIMEKENYILLKLVFDKSILYFWYNLLLNIFLQISTKYY